jgi:hypothetical protein
VIYSCSKDGSFLVNHVSEDGHRPSALLTESSTGWDPRGNLAFALGDGKGSGDWPLENPKRIHSVLQRWDDKVGSLSFRILRR